MNVRVRESARVRLSVRVTGSESVSMSVTV